MSSPYAQGLELLARVRTQVNDIKPDATNRRITIQAWYNLGQNWNALRMALIATGEAADKAKIASKLQRARCRIHINMSHRSGGLRARQANACLSQFRYVTALSQNARAMRHIHEAELLSWGNFQTHYQESLGPQAHMVRPHQTFLDSLGLKVEAVRWHQGLDMYAKNFHLTCQRLDVQKRRVDKARRRANHLKQIMVQCVSDYERLEAEVLAVQGAIQALQNTPLISISRETAGM